MLRSLVWFVVIFLISSGMAQAEPYIAMREGLNCSACHTNPTGGGKRNEFGNTYAQFSLAAERIGGGKNQESASSSESWLGKLDQYIGLGADFRGEYISTDTPGASKVSEFSYEESLVYFQFQPVPGRISLYVDQKFGPGASQTREAYGLFKASDSPFYFKAGRFFLPFGLRLEDDTAFTRSVTGISFDTPDDGIEAGFEKGAWSGQLAVTNGAGGGTEQDDDKQLSMNAVYTLSRWRLGGSFNTNETISGSRDMTAVYGGLNIGMMTWLLEFDNVTDDVPGVGESEQQIYLVEANTLLSKGSNLKVTYESLQFDDPNIEDRDRISVIWEYFPIQYTQFSFGYRTNDGADNLPLQNQDQIFAHIHLFF